MTDTDAKTPVSSANTFKPSAMSHEKSEKSSTVLKDYSFEPLNFEDSHKSFVGQENSFFGDNSLFFRDNDFYSTFTTTKFDDLDFKTIDYDDIFATESKINDQFNDYDENEFDETDISNIKKFLAKYGKESRKNSECKIYQKSEKFSFKMPSVPTVKMVSSYDNLSDKSRGETVAIQTQKRTN